MKRMHWSLLWLGVTTGLAGCYGRMEPGGVAAAPGSSSPIDTTRYAPAETSPIIYRGQQPELDKPLPPPVNPDTNVTARVRTPRLGTYRSSAAPRPDATKLPATRRVREATDRELRALSPVGKLPPSPVSRTDAEALPATPASAPAAPSTTE